MVGHEAPRIDLQFYLVFANLSAADLVIGILFNISNSYFKSFLFIHALPSPSRTETCIIRTRRHSVMVLWGLM